MKPKNWLSPEARRELRELRDLADAAEHSLWSRRVEAREALYRAAHEAVPQLLDEVERLETTLREREDCISILIEDRDGLSAERDALKAELEQLRARGEPDDDYWEPEDDE